MEEKPHTNCTFALVSVVAWLAGAVVVSRADMLAGLAAFLLTRSWEQVKIPKVRTDSDQS